MDGIKEDMNVAGVTLEQIRDRLKWKNAICCRDP